MISDLRKGDSLNPPTMKMKLTFSFFYSTYWMSYPTLFLMFSNKVWKNEAINAEDISTLESPFNFK